MAKPPRVIPPVPYHPETMNVNWNKVDALKPLDKPIVGSILDKQYIAEAVLLLMRENELLPEGIWTQVALSDLERDLLRVGDVLGPLLVRLGLEPYRDMPAPRAIPTVIPRNVLSRIPGDYNQNRAQYASLYQFIDEKTLDDLNISEHRAAVYYALLVGHMADSEVAVVEELLSARGRGVLSFQARERLNWWYINGGDLTDLYDSLCKTHKCSGECEMLHIQGLDTKGIKLLATVLQEPESILQ